MFSESIQTLLLQILQEYRTILGTSLTGLYLHGSLAFGCFRWDTGDIDFIAVTEEEPSQEQKEALIRALLRLTPQAPPKGLEMSVVLEKDCRCFTHPTPFVLHFSNSHLDACYSDLPRYCQTMRGTDPDLAAHFTVLRETGITLYGPPVRSLFAPVPEAAYWDSLRCDIQSAAQDILTSPVYVTLNLCRVLAWAQEKRVLSKEQGGRWGLARLPERFAPVIQSALSAYTGQPAAPADSTEAVSFARYMLQRLKF